MIYPRNLTLFPVQFEKVFIVCNIFPPEPPIALTDGVPLDPLSLTISETQSFTLAIEPGARVTCSTTADSGDGDLFMRFDAVPDYLGGDFICGSTSGLSEEICIARDPGGALVLWALVVAFTSVENLAITCSTTLPPGPSILTDGVASDPFSLSTDQTQTFTLTIASGDTVMCETAADEGDLALLVRWGTEPSLELESADCLSVGGGSVESCTVVDPGDASVLWVLVSAFSEVSRFGNTSAFSVSSIANPLTVLLSTSCSLPEPRSHVHDTKRHPHAQPSAYQKTLHRTQYLCRLVSFKVSPLLCSQEHV
jgi:hypothetical protein